jgi:hypothetical protein
MNAGMVWWVFTDDQHFSAYSKREIGTGAIFCRPSEHSKENPIEGMLKYAKEQIDRIKFGSAVLIIDSSLFPAGGELNRFNSLRVIRELFLKKSTEPIMVLVSMFPLQDSEAYEAGVDIIVDAQFKCESLLQYVHKYSKKIEEVTKKAERGKIWAICKDVILIIVGALLPILFNYVFEKKTDVKWFAYCNVVSIDKDGIRCKVFVKPINSNFQGEKIKIVKYPPRELVDVRLLDVNNSPEEIQINLNIMPRADVNSLFGKFETLKVELTDSGNSSYREYYPVSLPKDALIEYDKKFRQPVPLL